MTIYNIMGWGKGKTTSAIGIAARALMNDEIVLFCQFLKDDKDTGVEALSWLYGELDFGCLWHYTQGTKGIKQENCAEFWKELIKKIEIVKPDLIVFDELNVALDYNLFTPYTQDEIIEQIKSIATNSDVYITGRINDHHLRHKMIEMADIATNCYCEAHNFNATCKKCGMEFNPHYEYCPICGKKLTQSKEARIGRDC